MAPCHWFQFDVKKVRHRSMLLLNLSFSLDNFLHVCNLILAITENLGRNGTGILKNMSGVESVGMNTSSVGMRHDTTTM